MSLALIGLVSARPSDWIIYNPSPSVPSGLYVRIDGPPQRGSVVTVGARDVALSYAATRAFIGSRDRFIKRVAGVAGDRVCAADDAVTIGARSVQRLDHDRSGRTLPRWTGCRVLRDDEFFLLGDTADSFDSRYFGVVNVEQIEGVWRRL